jgi:hypothetical protein
MGFSPFHGFKDVARPLVAAYLGICRRTWNCLRKGHGATIIRWLLIAAAIAVSLYSGLEVARAEYLNSHQIAGAIVEFFLAAFGTAMFALVYSLFVYFATTYIAAFVGGLAVLIIGAALGLVGVAALFAVVSALLAWTAFSCLLFVPLRLGHWLWLQQRKITYKCPYDDCSNRGLPIHVCSCGAEYPDLSRISGSSEEFVGKLRLR